MHALHPGVVPELAPQVLDGLLDDLPCFGQVHPDQPVRMISIINRIFKACGLNDLEQLEDAPEYDPSVELNAEMVEAYLRGRVPANK